MVTSAVFREYERNNTMKQMFGKKKLFVLLAAVLCAISLFACTAKNAESPKDSGVDESSGVTAENSTAETAAETGVWADAVYREDTELGEGSKTVYITVQANEKSVIFTVHTDEETLGAALLELNLVEGETSQYGLYIKKVNGMTADYDIDQTYWGFFKDGEYMMVGVDSAEIADGDRYELVYSK